MNEFIKQTRNGVTIYTIPLLNNDKIKSSFTTRFGGTSTGYLKSMNMSFTRGDNRENVLSNYKRLALALDSDYKKFAFSYQVHTDNIHEVDSNNYGIDFGETNLIQADALITDKTGVTLIKHSADCTIVYIYDPINNAIGLVHSGWKSTVLNIVGKTIKSMEYKYSSSPETLLCAISPCIMECCFEVDREVSDKFEEVFESQDNVVSYEYKKPHVNLVTACTIQLTKAGVKNENISKAMLCTACNQDTFFSHRKTKGKCGLSVGTLCLK